MVKINYFRVSTILAAMVGAVLSATLAISISAGGSAWAATTLVNGGFEAGNLSGWSTDTTSNGSANAVTSIGTESSSYSPQEGSYFAVLTGGDEGVHTVISQQFSAESGDKISGWSFFATDDYLPYNDSAQVLIKAGNSVVATVFNQSVSKVGDYGSTPWTQWEHTFAQAGTYTVEARITNEGDDVVETYLGLDAVKVGTEDNEPPTVNAGPEQTATNSEKSATLQGEVSDDGKPNPPGKVTTKWTQVSGPTSKITSPSSLATKVSLPEVGEYVFKLTANDGEAEASDEVTIYRADHYTIELKAWIPHPKLVDPVHPAYPTYVIGPALDSCYSGKYPFSSIYERSTFRGDNHQGYDGKSKKAGHRARILVDFDWNGKTMENVKWKQGGDVGTTYRDFEAMQGSKKLKPCSLSGAGPPGAIVTPAADKQAVNLTLHQADPLVILAPPLDADLYATFPTEDTLQISTHTDLFPNYGYRVTKNKKTLFTRVTRETSCLPVFGADGYAWLVYGLNVHDSNVVTQFIPTKSTSAESVVDSCGAESPPQDPSGGEA